MKRSLIALVLSVMVLSLIAGACTPAPTAAPTAVPPTAPPATKAPEPTEPPKVSQGLPGKLEGMSWEEILAAADGQEVNWWMWGGSEVINRWVTGWVAPQMKEKFNITLNQVPVAGPTEFVNPVLGEKEAGKDENGAVSIMWINAENFKTMKDGDLLYGPFAEQLPAAEYYTWNDLTRIDSGKATEGYEAPFAQFQSTFAYDSARVPEPPKTVAELIQWIKDHPGRFTYPAPPDFVGSRFVRTICLDIIQPQTTPFDQAVFDEYYPKCYELLNELEPYLWREGETYPESMQSFFDLFAQGEIDIAFNTGAANWQNDIDSGRYPDTVRPFVLEKAAYFGNTFIAIAYNAPMAPAVVATNFIMSPEAQFQFTVDLNWIPMVDVTKVPDEWKTKFLNHEYPPAILTPDVLQENAIPQYHSSWYVPVEEGWTENVLLK
jgi:putative spermidine/putrescine transport system substrate-binding protein